jgi:8-oxo-dGTP pyrophosphatase MutT (NUDIX family)
MTSRVAARVIVIDRMGRVLLLRGGDPARPEDGTWWFTPGGGALPGKTVEETARRELREETGVDIDRVGPVVLTREVEFPFESETYQQVEYYFRIDVEPFDVDGSGWTEVERRVVVESRWWTIDELAATHDTVYPEGLIDLVRDSKA